MRGGYHMKRLAAVVVLLASVFCFAGCVSKESVQEQEPAGEATDISQSFVEEQDEFERAAVGNYFFEYPSGWEKHEESNGGLSVSDPDGGGFATLSVADWGEATGHGSSTDEILINLADIWAKSLNEDSDVPQVEKVYIGTMSGYRFSHVVDQDGLIVQAKTFLARRGDELVTWTVGFREGGPDQSEFFNSLTYEAPDFEDLDRAEVKDTPNSTPTPGMKTFGGVSLYIPDGWVESDSSEGAGVTRSYSSPDGREAVIITLVDIGDTLAEQFSKIGNQKEAIYSILDVYMNALETSNGVTGVVDMTVGDHLSKVGNFGSYGMCVVAIADSSHVVMIAADGLMDTVDSIVDSVTFAISMSAIESSM